MIFNHSIAADELLAIPQDEPERLFSGAIRIADEYRQLAKLWHPDVCTDPRAPEVFLRINQLHRAAMDKFRMGSWSEPGTIMLEASDGAYKKLRFYKRRRFELGEILYGQHKIGMLVDKGQDAFADRGVAAITSNRFSNDAMREEMEKYLPILRTSFSLKDGRRAIILDKTPDVFLLDDARKAAGGKLEAKHVAWIVSALFNIACYLGYSGRMHGAILADTVYVSPEHHSALLLGGWWYSAEEGRPISHLPTAIHRIAPPDLLRKKTADHRLDLIAIRALGRELLGDRTGMTLGADIPAPMLQFLRSQPATNAILDYGAWRACLETSFGPRRFVELVLPESAIINA